MRNPRRFTGWAALSGLNPNGTATARTLLDYQRWLLSEHQTSAFLPPARFLDTSYTEYATSVLGAWQP